MFYVLAKAIYNLKKKLQININKINSNKQSNITSDYDQRNGRKRLG